MNNINFLLEYFKEEVLSNTYTGKIIDGGSELEKIPTLVKIEAIEPSNQLLLSFKGKPIRVKVENFAPLSIKENVLCFIEKDNKDIILKFVETGVINNNDDILEIGYDENFLQTKKLKNINDIPKLLLREFCFETNFGDIIFIETYANKSDSNFTIRGKNKCLDIIKRDNKWIINKERRKIFSKDLESFKNLNVVVYKTIDFIEASKAKEALEILKEDESKGNTLISLWKVYSELELQKAIDIKELFGEIDFTRNKYLRDGLTRLKINHISPEQKATFKDHRDSLLNSSLELVNKDDNQKDTIVDLFFIKAINHDYTIDIYDELNILPEKGTFVISLKGNEIVNKRRENALKLILEKPTSLLRNLRLVIENRADVLVNKKRSEKPLTDRTRRFLQDKFGIDDLTPNQKEAVEIAINTNDLAIIQGPPGTGKSTVVAAICDRLIEIAEKSNDHNDKLILVSAFQNDTVEHIASKIYTLGLPTIKVGKEVQGNISAEKEFINDLILKIDNSLQSLDKKGNSNRISKKLTELSNLYAIELNKDYLINELNRIIKPSELNDELWELWDKINGNISIDLNSTDKDLILLKGLRLDIDSYNDDGFSKAYKLSKANLPFTEEEKDLLINAPVEDPDEDYLEKLKNLQVKYLERFNISKIDQLIVEDLDCIDWLEAAIRFFKEKEELEYVDDETFFASVLESLREDLEGNSEDIRDTIKEYSESIAATNQVAGGIEMRNFSTIQNVILEEAARSNPLDLLIPMVKATERIILVGDQNQLPHILEDDIAADTSDRLKDKLEEIETRKKLEESLFSVIFKNLQKSQHKKTITLTEQFRMHPFIGDFISKVYYNGDLKAGSENQLERKKHNLKLDWAKNKVAVFCDVNKSKGLEQSGKSKARKIEAERVIKLLDELRLDTEFENLSVGIITFYAKQVNEILNEATKKGYAVRVNDDYQIMEEFRETKDGREKLRIGSVDSFQGKEFDIVILSTVRSNDFIRSEENYRKIFGFLTLENRLNVAFSRAQKLVIVVGDGAMFSDELAKNHVEGLYEFYTTLSNDLNYGNRIQ